MDMLGPAGSRTFLCAVDVNQIDASPDLDGLDPASDGSPAYGPSWTKFAMKCFIDFFKSGDRFEASVSSQSGLHVSTLESEAPVKARFGVTCSLECILRSETARKARSLGSRPEGAQATRLRGGQGTDALRALVGLWRQFDLRWL